MTDSDRSDLLDTLDLLTQPHTVTTTLDDGVKHHETHDGLITQLREAIISDIGGGSGGKPARERIPLDADALTKYEAIVKRITAHANEYGAMVAERPEDTLRAWYVMFMQTATEQAITNQYRVLYSWARTIEDKLSPATIRELPNETCPECGFAWYDQIVNKGKRVGTQKGWVDSERQIALTITYRPDNLGGLNESFVKCGCCNHVWMGSRGIREIAYILDKRHEPQDVAS